MVKVKCQGCDKEFEAHRTDAKYHSEACRKKHKRGTGDVSKESPASPEKYSREFYQKRYNIHPTTFLPYEPLTIPENVITLIAGKQGVGKSTIALDIAKKCTDAGKRVLYIDSESSLTDEKLNRYQFNPELFELLYITYMDELFDLVKTDDLLSYDLVIVDGLERLLSINEQENDAYSKNIGSKAHLLNKIIRVISMRFYKAQTTTILVNHLRDNMSFGGTYVPGGTGQENAAAHYLKLHTIANKRFQKDGKVAGHIVFAKVAKSRYMSPHQELQLKLTYDTGEITNVTPE